ncbi:hypothetical protein Rsub_06555, partial [Raphidocelis subcapitata]
MGSGAGASHSAAAGAAASSRGARPSSASGAPPPPPQPRPAEAPPPPPPEAAAAAGAAAPRRGRFDAWRLLIDAAATRGDALAVVDWRSSGASSGASSGGGASSGSSGAAGLTLTYPQLASRAARLASALAAAGASRGARVAVLMRNRCEVLEAHYAAAALHAVVVNLNTALAPDELAFLLSDSRAAVVLSERALAAPLALALGRLPEDARPAVMWAPDGGDEAAAAGDGADGGGAGGGADEPPPPPLPPGAARLPWPAGAAGAGAAGAAAGLPAFDLEEGAGDDDGFHLYYTSGTTGRPKGVLLSHRVVVLHALGTVV